jgi:hypothetical protein
MAILTSIPLARRNTTGSATTATMKSTAALCTRLVQMSTVVTGAVVTAPCMSIPCPGEEDMMRNESREVSPPSWSLRRGLTIQGLRLRRNNDGVAYGVWCFGVLEFGSWFRYAIAVHCFDSLGCLTSPVPWEVQSLCQSILASGHPAFLVIGHISHAASLGSKC